MIRKSWCKLCVPSQDSKGKPGYAVIKRYFSDWYKGNNGNLTRDVEDFFDTFFYNRKDANAWCDKFNLNCIWY